jgi:hypothetical protein
MSKLTALAEYVHTWAPIATQLLASDNDAVKMYGVKIQQEVDGCTETQVKTECTIEL